MIGSELAFLKKYKSTLVMNTPEDSSSLTENVCDIGSGFTVRVLRTTLEVWVRVSVTSSVLICGVTRFIEAPRCVIVRGMLV